MKALDGQWKVEIIFHLFAEPVMRFSELERAIPAVSQKMLTQQLRQLERDGVVQRTVHALVPPRVDYELTELGRELRPVLALFRGWRASLRGMARPAD
jgi:DNA-binding HxlR family transcriptional regulator